MKRIGRIGCLGVVCAASVIALVPERTSANDKLNFSGIYVVDQGKEPSEGENISTLEVIQNDDSIEITRVKFGEKNVSHCPLNGSDGDYTTPNGMRANARRSLSLILESVVLTRPQQAALPLRVHTEEKWQLSPDAKTLTIKSDVDFPDVPADVSAMVANSYASGTVKTKRTGP